MSRLTLWPGSKPQAASPESPSPTARHSTSASAAMRLPPIGWRRRAHSGQSDFSIAASQPNPSSENWHAPKRPLATSPCRPYPATQCGLPIGIVDVCFDQPEWPVFGDHFLIDAALTRPWPTSRATTDYFTASARSLSVTFPERCRYNKIANGLGILRPDS